MADREKVANGVKHCFHGQECCGDIECPYYIEHLSDSCCLEECQENLKADIIALIKEQEGTIKELQNAYGYLQKQFFAVQDKLLKEQDNRENCAIAIEDRQHIVRCKDCKYNDDGECIIKAGWFPVKPDWFCADGERRSE